MNGSEHLNRPDFLNRAHGNFNWFEKLGCLFLIIAIVGAVIYHVSPFESKESTAKEVKEPLPQIEPNFRW